jgi:hypothetical protein
MNVPNPLTRPVSLPALRIFVSCHHKDNSFGIKLVRDLRAVLSDDTAVWYTVDSGLQGPDYPWSRIVEELSTRNVYIFVLSPDAVSSSWVNSEMSIALRQHVSQAGKLIPVIYRRCKIPQGYDIYQNVSFKYKPYEVVFNELLLTLVGLPAKKVGMILSARRLLQLLLVFLLVVTIIAGSIFASYQLFKPKPITRVGITAAVSPTASVDIATPTVSITPLPNLYPNPPGTLNSDPLGNTCGFSHSAYHISAEGQLNQLGQFNINSCYSSPSVTNFVYEIQMTIAKGDFGGILFRYQPPPSTTTPQRYYDFLVSPDGMYQLIITGASPTLLVKGYSQFINKGLNVQNTLAVVASGSHIDLYINQHIVASLKDATLSQGFCGISAVGINNLTEVTFTNPKVWSV